jgi:integrase
MKANPGLRQLADGRWRFRTYADGTKAGRRVQVTLPKGTTRRDAEIEYSAAVARAAARAGRPIPKRLTFEDAADEYLAVQRTRLAAGTLRNVESTVSRLKDRFGKRLVSSLRPSDVTAYQTDRVGEKVMASTINTEVTWLVAIVRKMVGFGWLEKDPLPRGSVESLPTPAPKTDFFRVDEWERFLDALEERRPDAVPILRALLLTSARIGEVCDLTWSGVDLDGKRITFEMSKRRGEPKSLPITPELAEVLAALPRGVGKAPVFTRPDGSAWKPSRVLTALYTARDTALLRKSLNVHSVRHTAASWMAQNGVPLIEIMETLGHSNIRQTMRYAHLLTEHLTRAVDTVAAVEKSGRRHRGATERT